jgi:RHS repeat-associated protein
LDWSSFNYDAENKQMRVETIDENGNPIAIIGQYAYDGDGKRVKKYVPSSGETTIFVYDASNRLVAEYSTAAGPATTAKTSYLTNDHLGSPRVLTDQLGQVISRRDFHPFGEEIATAERTAALGYTADGIRQKFTSYERDKETDLDYAKARMFGSSLGRFTSPDPLLSSGRVVNPHTWNRYNYVLGNPLRYSDPLGFFEWDETAGGDATDEELQARSTDRNLTKKERKAARKALKFRTNFRIARQTAIDRINSSKLSTEEKMKALAAIGAYGQENDNNGVIVAARSALGTGTGASTRLQGDGTILVTFNQNDQSSTLSLRIAHEGQHVYDADQFLSNPQADGDTDLNHRQREMRAYEITSYVAQAFSRGSAIEGVEEKYQVWNKGWAKLDEAERNSKRTKGIDAFVSSTYVGYPESSPGKKYSEEFVPNR